MISIWYISSDRNWLTDIYVKIQEKWNKINPKKV